MTKQALFLIDMLKDFVLEGAPLEVPDTQQPSAALSSMTLPQQVQFSQNITIITRGGNVRIAL